jgi:hypothetical protein
VVFVAVTSSEAKPTNFKKVLRLRLGSMELPGLGGLPLHERHPSCWPRT